MSPIRTEEGPLLVVVPNVGIAIEGDRAFLDIKAAEGMSRYARHWPGPVRWVGRAAARKTIAYGAWYETADQPFDIRCAGNAADAREIATHCVGASLVVGGADNHLDIGLVDHLPPETVVFIIENTLRTRLDFVRLERHDPLSKLKKALWLVKTEYARRQALRNALAIQANGTPAYRSYRRADRDDLLFFDTRLDRSLAITSEGLEAKAAAVIGNTGFRLGFSGRLEPAKGADRLVPVLAAVHRRGVPQATLDIYGDGSLREEIRRQAEAAGLGRAIRLHGPVPFDAVLVPALKHSVDLFVCCHLQSDPSCTYLETLGCGVPIAGFRNQAFDGVLGLGDCGVAAPLNDIEALATRIVALARDRQRLAALTRTAAAVGTRNLFEDVFEQRIAHLRRVMRRHS
jgi:glycosyltransferase involved in cell wall biosynthesis